jgi:hypothetical protein
MRLPGRRARQALEVSDGALVVPMEPFETATLRVRLAATTTTAPDAAGDGAVPGESTLPEPVQPVYGRYWLHGKGPAPAGNLPTAAHFTPTRVTLGAPGNPAGAAGAATVELTVACGPAGATGTVELAAPGELTVTVAAADSAAADAPGGRLGYALEPNGFAAWTVTVSAPPGTPDGRYFLTARIADELGQVVEDVALVTVGEPGPPDASQEPEELFFRMQSDVMALAGEAELELLTPALALTPGATGELAVRVSSHVGSPVRGEAQLISPVGTWEAAGPWTQGVEVAPGGEATVRFAVTVPATAAPGWESWLLVKLMYFGRVRYSESARLTVV